MHIPFTVMRGKKKMKELIKNNYKYLIFLAIFGLVGGYFTALYSVQSVSQDVLNEAISQVGSIDVLIIITTLQSLGYALILGFIGKILAKKIGLWRDVTFNKKGNIELILITLVGGTAFILLDVLVFASFSEVIEESYAIKPSFEYIFASVTYGAVIEEIMLRLFFMSIIAFIIQKITKKESMNNMILIIANIISAILFAAGHLPTTISTIGITPMILIRCFVMNGGFGLMFGRLYRKYGIHLSLIHI